MTDGKIAIMVLSTGMEIIGEVMGGDSRFGIDSITVRKPSVVSVQPTGIGLRSIFDGNPAFQGPDLNVARHAVVMIASPNKKFLDAYIAHRSGILAPSTSPRITGVNQ